VVLSVSVVVILPLAGGVTADALHVGAGLAAGVMLQEKDTLALKPALEVTVRVDVAEPPGETVEGDSAVPAIVKVGMGLKVAVTDSLTVRATEQAPVPEQPAPLQPAKVEPAAGVAVSEIFVPPVKLAVHVPGQLIPLGLLVTVPLPEPATTTVSLWCTGGIESRSHGLVHRQSYGTGTVPDQPAPLQPAKVEPAAGVAVSEIFVPPVKLAVHVPGQLIPLGLLVTVPLPEPATTTVSGGVLGGLKVAVTNWLAFSVMEQTPLLGQPAPLQPANVEPVVGVAISVTCLLLAKLPEHVPTPGQLIPLGLLLTVPVPTPASVTRIPEVSAVYRSTKASGR
jgi:hypothetical protein